MSKLDQLLKESKLDESLKSVILEAWNDEKQELAAEIRDEMKARFEDDRKAVVEGLNKMAKEVISEEMSKVYNEKRKLVEDRAVLRANLSKFSDFSNGVLAEEIKELRTDRKSLSEGIAKFAQFSNNIIAEELVEFHNEKQELVEARVKLATEGKKRIDEAKRQFVANASKNAAKFIEDQTRQEFTQLRGQLQEAQKNMFGRKLFEAFAAEFMATQYNENVEIRKIMEGLTSTKRKLSEAEEKLSSATNAIQQRDKTIRIMEDTSARGGILSKLMKPLNVEQKMVMEGLLEKTPTAELEKDFKKYLTPVLKESGQPRRKETSARAPLTESQKEVTGNRKQKIFESKDQENAEFSLDLDRLTKIAGITK